MIITLISSVLLLFLLCALIRFLHKVWWTPIRIKNLMKSQGIKGPSYKFLHGSTKEIISMMNESSRSPMELSHDIFPRMQPHIYTWVNLYGKNFLNWYGPQPQLVVTEPELIKEILNDKNGAYPKTEIPSIVKKLLGDGLVASKGEKWAKLRKISNHAFYAESLKGMIPSMIASVETMLERWRQHEGKEVEVYEEFRVLTSDVISRTAFGSSFKEGENIFDMLAQLGVLISRNYLKIRFPLIGIVRTKDDIESDKLEQAICGNIREIIKKREEKLMKGGEAENYGSDFLGSLLMAKHDPDEKKRISIDDMIDECKTFYNSGQETTTSLLAWSVLLLAIHTDWQDKVRKEVIELFGHEDPHPAGLARLKIMSMVLNETLRLYDPVLNVVRTVKKKVTVGNLTLPANMDLLIPPLALHHNPQIWGEDVHLFKPERFAEGVAKASNDSVLAFLPFGFGPRTCVGTNFAANEAKIALSMILQRYKFTLSPNYVHSPAKVLTVRPKYGVQIILSPL